MDVYEVKVLPYNSTRIVIGCDLTVERLQCIERKVARITGALDDGWPFDISPSTIPFINPGTQRFHVQVTIPPGVSTNPRNLTLTVSVSAPGISPFMATTSCLIIPTPIYIGNVEPIGSPCIVGEDGSARFPVRIWNTGNTEDVYSIALKTSRTPVESWDGPSEVEVPPRSFVETNITLRYQEPKYPDQIWSAELTINSSQAPEGNAQPIHYVGDPSSTALLVFDPGPAIGPILGLDMSAGMTVFIIQMALLFTVLVIYRKTGTR
jgi:hypothetical protein